MYKITLADCNSSGDDTIPFFTDDLEELVWTRMNLNEEYFPDKYIVFGHTPTCYFWVEEKGVSLEEILREENCNHIFRKGKLIGIDCGCAYVGYLGCLCLETMEEIYV